MRVVSWNVDQSANSNGRIDRQLETIGILDPDLLLLQEVRYSGANDWLQHWRDGLEALGLSTIEHSCDWAAELNEATYPPHSDIDHNNGHLTATSGAWALERVEHTIRDYADRHDWTHYPTHFPEKLLVTELETPNQGIEVWNVRAVPGSEYGEEKIKILETVYKRLTTAGRRTRLLAGDFNAPKDELPDGQLLSFGHDKAPTIRDRWVAAERNILQGLGHLGIVDAFRSQHGYGELDVPDTSWRDKRFDHLLVSEELLVVDCWYDHSVEGSDHAPLVADIELSNES